MADPQYQAAVESSSQSSSADNGDPQTPSPLYSEPTVNNVSTEAHLNDSIDGSLEEAQSIDPHFARLLSALSLSAAKPGQTTDIKPPSSTSLPPVTESQPVLAPITPIPSVSSTASHVAEFHDWSMRGPRKGMHQPAPVPDTDVQVPPRPLSKISNKSSKSDLLSNPSGTRAVSPAFSLASSASASVAMSTTSGASGQVAPSSRHSSAATADISPYLSRPSVVPVNGKRLKQLALLESLADESARMTPVLGHRAPTAFNAANVPAPSASIEANPNTYPLPSASVPPPSHSNNLSTVYPNIQGLTHMPPSLPQPHFPNPGLPAVIDDPFTVRPRTSNTFRPVFSHAPRPFNTRGSMSQAQLLSALGSGPIPPQRSVFPIAQPQPLITSVAPGQGYNPSPLLSSRFGPLATAGPIPSLGALSATNLDAARISSTNSNLLSILNSGGSNGQGAPSSVWNRAAPR